MLPISASCDKITRHNLTLACSTLGGVVERCHLLAACRGLYDNY